MKLKFTLLLTLYFVSNSILFSQGIEKMNKSELREQITILTDKIYSLINENKELQESKAELTSNYSVIEKKCKTNEIEIDRLNKVISQLELEHKQKISQIEINQKQKNLQKEIEISNLNHEIVILNDSILKLLNTNSSVISTELTSDNDFLNNYYFNQTPISNAKFRLVLSKVIFSDPKKELENYDYSQYKIVIVESLPELIDIDDLTFWGVKPTKDIIKNSLYALDIKSNERFNVNTLQNIFEKKTSDYLNSKLPQIEILKNKLFTLTYNDGTEEAFLFNVSYAYDYDNNNNNNNNNKVIHNNQRKILQIELANEEVEGDKSKDLIWRIYAIENECYLALNLRQLYRIKSNLRTLDFRSSIIGDEVYVSRNLDKFMDKSEFIDCDKLIYLFKLK